MQQNIVVKDVDIQPRLRRSRGLVDREFSLEELGVFPDDLGIVHVHAEIDLEDAARGHIDHLDLVRCQVCARRQRTLVQPEQMTTRQNGGNMELTVNIRGDDRSVFHGKPDVRHRAFNDLFTILSDIIRIILFAVLVPVIEHLTEDRARIEERIKRHRYGRCGTIGQDRSINILHGRHVLITSRRHTRADDKLITHGLFLFGREITCREPQRAIACGICNGHAVKLGTPAHIFKTRRNNIDQLGQRNSIGFKKTFNGDRIRDNLADLGICLVRLLFNPERVRIGIHRLVHLLHGAFRREQFSTRPGDNRTPGRKLGIGELGRITVTRGRDLDLERPCRRKEEVHAVRPRRDRIDIQRAEVNTRHRQRAIGIIDRHNGILDRQIRNGIEHHAIDIVDNIFEQLARNTIHHHRHQVMPARQGRR